MERGSTLIKEAATEASCLQKRVLETMLTAEHYRQRAEECGLSPFNRTPITNGRQY